MGLNSGIRFFAPVSWRGRVRTSDVRRLLSQYRGAGLAPDPGPGQFQAKVLLNGERVRRLAAAEGRDVSGFLRCLLAPRMPSAPIRKRPVTTPRSAVIPASPLPTRATEFRLAANRTEYVIPKQTSTQTPARSLRRPDERRIVPAFCSQCGAYREGVMAGVPPRFRCLTCGAS